MTRTSTDRKLDQLIDLILLVGLIFTRKKGESILDYWNTLPMPKPFFGAK